MFDFTAKRYTIERLMRWSLEFQRVRYVIHHIPGERNHLADFFSRGALNQPVNVQRKRIAILRVQKPSEQWLAAREVFRSHRVQAF